MWTGTPEEVSDNRPLISSWGKVLADPFLGRNGGAA